MGNLSSEQAKGLPEEYATVINRLGNLTRDILSKGYEKRMPEQYGQFAKDIQSFYDGINQYAMENFTADKYYQQKQEMKKFLKKIGRAKDISIMESAELPPEDAELQFAQFFFTRDLKVLKPLFRKYCSPYWEWDSDWDKPEKMEYNNEIRPDQPYWGWHSGEAEAPAQYKDIILHSKTADDFAKLDQKFMDSAEVIQQMIYLAVMKKKLLDTINSTMCPRSRWHDGHVVRFHSCDGESYVDWTYPGGANGRLRGRALSVCPAVSI